MIDVIHFIFFVFSGLLSLISFAIIVWAILSWLVAFDVVNMRNRFVYSISTALDGFVRPFLYPLQRMIPSLGGMDITPIIALLIIQGMQIYLLPGAEAALVGMASGGV
ncbi:MAG: YggT family protein [Caulobacteraceae bacterium]|nr:YggT family protein [Caulobacteraceae bacterium]